MRGLIFLFLAVVFFGLSWRYMDKQSKKFISELVRGNLWTFVLGLLAVAVAVFLSLNTTVRLV